MTDILSHLGLKRGQLNDAFMIEKPHWPEIKEQILLPKLPVILAQSRAFISGSGSVHQVHDMVTCLQTMAGCVAGVQ